LRRFALVALLAALAGAVAIAAPALAAAKRHNIVVIMTDDQDFRSMSAMPQTQRLIGARGTTFAQAIVSFPLCCPSRATYYTGQYAHNHGVTWNFFPLGGYYLFKQDEVLPLWLQRAGYRTIHIGKYLNQTDERGDHTEIPNGWSDYMGGVDPTTYDYYGMTINDNGRLVTYPRDAAHYSTDVYARLAEGAIADAAKRDQPFFLNIAPNAPHTVSAKSDAEVEGTPALPPPRYKDRYQHVSSFPHYQDRFTPAATFPRYPDMDEADMSDKPAWMPVIFPALSAAQKTSLLAHYRGRTGAIRGVDDLVAGVVRALRRAGVDDSTDILFTSDNGWMLGEHRLVDTQTQDGRASGVKYFAYEGSSRVPLLAAGPDFPRGQTVQGVVVNADLAPTIAEIAGATPGLAQDGRSLLAPARDPALLNGRGVLLEGFENPRGAPPYASIRTQRYRYDLQSDGTEQLYDLQLDPWELQSVHADPRYAQVKTILAAGLERLRACAGASCQVDVGPLPEPGA
jgi:arylsulfatase A-like enzyme